MEQLFVLRIRKHGDGPNDQFFHVGTHWHPRWDDSSASIFTAAYVEQTKKDLWERCRLAEGIDYDRVQVG